MGLPEISGRYIFAHPHMRGSPGHTHRPTLVHMSGQSDKRTVQSCAQLLHHSTPLLEPLLSLVGLVSPGPQPEPGLQPELET